MSSDSAENKPLPQPGVYVFKCKNKLLYVGSTSDLSKRPMKRDRGHASRWAAIMQADSTDLIPCKSIAHAQRLEQHLIITKAPKYNQRNASAPPDLVKAFRIAKNIR